MRWKNIEISSFSIHNAFGYTSPPATQEPLLKEKPFKCGANIVGSTVERTMLFKFSSFESFFRYLFSKR